MACRLCPAIVCIFVVLASPLDAGSRPPRAPASYCAAVHTDDQLRPIPDSLAAVSRVLLDLAMPPAMVKQTIV
jgi:hypothetical protein